MPWKESSVMDERLRFVARLLEGETMTEVCRDFGISRKTGYKIFDRYKEHGLEALADRSRRPVRFPNQFLEARIVAIRHEKPNWGVRKIRSDCPAISACRPRVQSTPFSIATGSSPRPPGRAAAPPERRSRAE
jgi:transposase-like protein